MSGIGRIAAWLAAAAGSAALIAGCAGKPAPAPAPAPEPPIRQAPPPAPVPPLPESSQQDPPDPPLSPGDWSYAGDGLGSVARFGPSGAESFSLRCDTSGRRIILFRQGSPAALRVRTTYGQRALAPGAGLAADDVLLDEMVFSRGRFTVEADGLPALIVPTWPEPARVVEDCRG
ncbi:MAG TPA: hypothetical protein VK403_13070 [Allosphingosinicella sp.]|nr:hypothetical protein [Allosphingosinicella sp.]